MNRLKTTESGELQLTEYQKQFLLLVKEGKICTDSDIVDFCYNHHLSVRETYDFLNQVKTHGTPCEGCQYAGGETSYPCINCNRNKQDYYKERED